jgi:hypothetical protein
MSLHKRGFVALEEWNEANEGNIRQDSEEFFIFADVVLFFGRAVGILLS